MTDSADYLLETHGIINLPVEINHGAYEQLLHRLMQGRDLHGDRPLMLYCRNDGGSAWDMEAMCQLIEADGNVDGVLIGSTVSAGATVWASCARRFVYPGARMGIHVTKREVGYTSEDVLTGLVAEGQVIDRFNCQRYALASERDYEWWWQKMHAPGDFKWLDMKELIEIGMATHYYQRAEMRLKVLEKVPG